MAKFRKKPVIIEAEQWFKGKKIDGVIDDGPFVPTGNWHDRFDDRPDVYIKTLEGNMAVSEGDWIITGVKGEKYPCKPDIFEKTYEPVND